MTLLSDILELTFRVSQRQPAIIDSRSQDSDPKAQDLSPVEYRPIYIWKTAPESLLIERIRGKTANRPTSCSSRDIGIAIILDDISSAFWYFLDLFGEIGLDLVDLVGFKSVCP